MPSLTWTWYWDVSCMMTLELEYFFLCSARDKHQHRTSVTTRPGRAPHTRRGGGGRGTPRCRRQSGAPWGLGRARTRPFLASVALGLLPGPVPPLGYSSPPTDRVSGSISQGCHCELLVRLSPYGEGQEAAAALLTGAPASPRLWGMGRTLRLSWTPLELTCPLHSGYGV